MNEEQYTAQDLELLPDKEEIIAGRYLVLELLGSGGMGQVFKVEQIFLNSIHALKILTTIDASSMTRFQKEARITYRLQHPNLVAVTDLGTLENGMPFLVMDFVDGISLSQHLRKVGPLPVKETLDIYIQLCEGLAFAHSQGVVHRDLKPSNFMIVSRENTPSGAPRYGVKIIDFGIARIIQDEGDMGQFHTKTGDVLGSPLYMSPEQCAGGKIDERSDIYSLGCALYETLTGVPPYRSDNALSTMRMHQIDPVPSLNSPSAGTELPATAQFPQSLEQVVQKLLAKDPADRYQTVPALQAQLIRIRKELEGASAAQPKGAKRFKVVALVLLPLMLVSIVGGIAFKVLSPKKNILNAPISAEFAPVPQLISDRKPIASESMEPFAPLTIAQARSKNCKWVLQFPKEASVGTVGLKMGENPDWRHEAQGDVEMKYPDAFMFEANSDIVATPTLFRRFRFDEIDGIDIHGGKTVNDETLFCLNHLTNLRYLKLPSGKVTDKGLDSIRSLTLLEEFKIKHHLISGHSLASLPWLKHLTALETSNLDGEGSLVVRALSGSSSIKLLDISQANIKDADFEDMGKCKNLSIINVMGSPLVTGAGLHFLTKLPLKSLSLKSCSIARKFLPELAQLPKLQSLSLADDNLEDSDIEFLVPCKNLIWLDLSNSPRITDHGLTYISQLGHLQKLYLDHCSITPDSIQVLKSMSNLRELDIDNSDWTDSQNDELMKALPPNCRLMRLNDWTSDVGSPVNE